MHEYKCTITRYRKDMFCISIRKDAIRYRYYNGEPIGEPDKPNLLPEKKRYKGFLELLVKYRIALRAGWIPNRSEKSDKSVDKILDRSYLQRVYEDKRKEGLSEHFYKDFRSYINRLKPLVEGEITEDCFQKMVDTHLHWSNTSFNHFLRYSALIEKGLTKYGYTGNWSKKTKKRKQTEVLHKRILDCPFRLFRLLEYNKHLHLCALLTYGCLLRPHREVRELTWGDFNEDLTMISLSGARNKSKRNRIIPVPEYVRKHLSGGMQENNIFSGTPEPYNPYYFSLLWRRFKQAHPEIVQPGETLYSFRHAGAIAVYENTRNIKILHTVMGHSDMAVSLTYLRGLEVHAISIEDMPTLSL